LTLAPNAVAVPIVAAAPSLALALTVTPSSVAVPIVVPDPAVGSGLFLQPNPVAVPLATPAPNVNLALALAPTPVPIALVLPAPALILPKLLTPSPVAVVLGIPQPVVLAGSQVLEEVGPPRRVFAAAARRFVLPAASRSLVLPAASRRFIFRASGGENMLIHSFEKRAVESYPIAFDMARKAPEGSGPPMAVQATARDMLTQQDVTATVIDGTAVQGNLAICVVKAGVAGRTYEIRTLITLTDGSILEEVARMRIEDAAVVA
jgi:hypothetical protein